MIDHVTYEVPPKQLANKGLADFFKLLEMKEVRPDKTIEGKWKVRWWAAENGVCVHLVEGERVSHQIRGLEHFAIYVSREAYARCRRSLHLERDSMTGRDDHRLWLEGPLGLRVEVRSHG